MNRMAKFLFSFALFILACYGGLVWFVNTEVEKALQESVSNVEGLTLDYKDLWVDLGDRTLTLTGVDSTLPTGQHFTASEVVVYAFDERNPTPHFIKVLAKGLEVPAADLTALGLPMAALEPGTVTGDLLLDYRYAPEQQALTVNALSFDSEALGEIELSGTVTQLDLDAFRMEKLVGLCIKDLEFRFANGSFMDSLMTQAAASVGTTKENVRGRMASELAAMSEQAGRLDKPVAEKALRGLKDFMENPGTITISARPAEPVPCLYFFMGRDMYDNLDMMNVSVITDSSANNNQ